MGPDKRVLTRNPGTVLGVIPARYGSTRFPGKPLARVDGRTLIELVWERAKRAKSIHRLVVATDDERIFQAVEAFGGEAVMTSHQLISGTDRTWEVAKKTEAQIVVNIQGDEPLLQPAMVDTLVKALEEDPAAEMVTLRFSMRGVKGYADPNVVKVVSDQSGFALYFSRAPIPAVKASRGSPDLWYKHIGIYGYRRKVLRDFVGWAPSPLEKSEGLEQLRILEQGVRIKVLDSPSDTIGVDTPEDLERVKRILSGA